MPAACSLSGRLSTRNASTTMSWVDDIAATRTAPSATNSGERAGSVSASSRIETISSSCEHTSQPRRRPKSAREQRHMQRIRQRRPQEFQRVGRADQREQPDGAEIDAGFAHPHQKRRSRQRQRQPGGKAEQHDDQHPRVADRPQGSRARRRGGRPRISPQSVAWAGCRGHWSCRSASRIRAAVPPSPSALKPPPAIFRRKFRRLPAFMPPTPTILIHR